MTTLKDKLNQYENVNGLFVTPKGWMFKHLGDCEIIESRGPIIMNGAVIIGAEIRVKPSRGEEDYDGDFLPARCFELVNA